MTKLDSILGALRLVKQRNGYNFAIGLYGTPEAIHDAFLLLSNSGVTGGELLDVGGERFAYVWTDENRWAWYLAKWEIDSMGANGELPRMDKVESREFFDGLRVKWEDVFDAMETEDFVPENGITDFTDCLGVGMVERPARLAACED